MTPKVIFIGPGTKVLGGTSMKPLYFPITVSYSATLTTFLFLLLCTQS